ncbi:MAG: PqqD family protein [Prevotella sp.]|nr:PqqD family protein [Prevotella sp.]
MKTKKGFNLRNICGENIIVAEGIENIDFSRIISMNESASYLWKNIQGQDFSSETLTQLLLEEYDVDEQTARNDADTLISKWLEAGIIE